MHLAAIENRVDVLKLLIAARANPKGIDTEGDQPLHWAATKVPSAKCLPRCHLQLEYSTVMRFC